MTTMTIELPDQARLAIERLCQLQAQVCEEVVGFEDTNDCFCGGGGEDGPWFTRTGDGHRFCMTYSNSQRAIDFITHATRLLIAHPELTFAAGQP